MTPDQIEAIRLSFGATAFTATVSANILTIMFLYGVFRLDKNGRDWLALAMVLFVCLFAGIGVYALRWPN